MLMECKAQSKTPSRDRRKITCLPRCSSTQPTARGSLTSSAPIVLEAMITDDVCFRPIDDDRVKGVVMQLMNGPLLVGAFPRRGQTSPSVATTDLSPQEPSDFRWSDQAR
jgi:hypothetical protein